MVRTSLVILFFVIGFFSGKAQTAEEQVLSLAKKKFEWLIQRQQDSLLQVLDERVYYIHSNGFTETREGMLSNLISGRMVYESVKVDSMYVRIFDKTAVVNGTGLFAGSIDNKSFEVNLLFTEVYVIKKGRWYLISRHASRLP